MNKGKTQCITVFYEDYQRLIERKNKIPGLTMAGLVHILLDKTEPPPRDKDGKFKSAN